MRVNRRHRPLGSRRPLLCALPLCLLPIVVAGCSAAAAPAAAPIRPVKTMVVAAGDSLRTRVFPGRVEASRRVELAFQVPGLLVSLPVREGEKVAKDAVIGKLREDEFQARLKALQGQLDQARAALRALQVGERAEERLRRDAQLRAAEARLSNARTEFDRSQRLFDRKAMSQAEFEVAQTVFKVAQEEHEAARLLIEKGAIAREEDIEAQQGVVRGLEGRVVEANLQLKDCILRAPYDGVIAQRFVEERQNVRAKEPVVRFQDVEEIEIAVDVPETVMLRDVRSADIVTLQAEFAGAPGRQFPVEIREIAQVADPTTQTFVVRAAMKTQSDVNLLPGMTATVTAAYRRASILGDRILVPVSAVFKAEDGQQIVWIVGADDVVQRRAVKIGGPTGGDVEIVDGLLPGDRIAVAGVSLLRDGMKVRDLGGGLGGG